jgi:hypothetical protein
MLSEAKHPYRRIIRRRAGIARCARNDVFLDPYVASRIVLPTPSLSIESD